jgi:FrmR/RcnR family transcriptional regulator, repressor of rcnA expression
MLMSSAIEAKTRLKARISRLNGQVQALSRMMDAERPCQDILRQVSAVCGASKGLWRAMMEFHLRHCLGQADAPQGQEVLESFLTALEKF